MFVGHVIMNKCRWKDGAAYWVCKSVILKKIKEVKTFVPVDIMGELRWQCG